MKQFTVYLTKKIQDSTKQLADTFTFYSVSTAKRFIKQHIDIYKTSSITKIWSNGDWENLGEIQLTGSNKHFIANAGMSKANY